MLDRQRLVWSRQAEKLNVAYVSIVVGHQHKSSHQLLAEPIVCGAVSYALLQPFRFCSQSVIVPNVKVIGRELKRLQPRPVYHLKLSDQGKRLAKSS